MRIRIQLSKIMRIRIQLPKIMRIRIRHPSFKTLPCCLIVDVYLRSRILSSGLATTRRAAFWGNIAQLFNSIRIRIQLHKIMHIRIQLPKIMRIRIQLSKIMRIRIQLPKIRRIRIRHPSFKTLPCCLIVDVYLRSRILSSGLATTRRAVFRGNIAPSSSSWPSSPSATCANNLQFASFSIMDKILS
jgi:hypothetical protein